MNLNKKRIRTLQFINLLIIIIFLILVRMSNLCIIKCSLRYFGSFEKEDISIISAYGMKLFGFCISSKIINSILIFLLISYFISFLFMLILLIKKVGLNKLLQKIGLFVGLFFITLVIIISLNEVEEYKYYSKDGIKSFLIADVRWYPTIIYDRIYVESNKIVMESNVEKKQFEAMKEAGDLVKKIMNLNDSEIIKVTVRRNKLFSSKYRVVAITSVNNWNADFTSVCYYRENNWILIF